jgi:peptidoglycan/LPS O-acetylase OafA/YrhL
MSGTIAQRILGKRVDLSYGLYLFGLPNQQLIIFHFLPGKIDPLSLFVMSLPAASVIAYLSWRFIEAPKVSAQCS